VAGVHPKGAFGHFVACNDDVQLELAGKFGIGMAGCTQ
jgi:hypothetical protein